MYIPIIGFILILFSLSSECFERRFSVDSVADGLIPSAMPLRPWVPKAPPESLFKALEAPLKEFDFYAHCQKKHARIAVSSYAGITTEQMVVMRESPVMLRPDHVYSTVHDAALANDPKGIARLLQVEHHRTYLNGFDTEGQTPLQAAIDYGCDRAITFLISQGAHADISNQDGEYTAWTLATLYAESTAWTNVVSLMALQQALAAKNGLHKYYSKKKKYRKDESLAQKQPSKIKRTRTQVPLEELLPEPELPYNSYLLNV